MAKFRSLVQASLARWPNEMIAKVYFSQLRDMSCDDLIDSTMEYLMPHWDETKQVLKASIEEENPDDVRNMLVMSQGFTAEQAEQACADPDICKKILVRIIASQAIETKYPSIFADISQDSQLCEKFQTVVDRLVDLVEN